MNIRVLITGGTIDGLDIGKTVEKSIVPKLLKDIGINATTEVLMMKDSREIDDKDLELIYTRCRDCAENKIVLTHGTMTMVKTGKFLLDKKIDKTIILTGAMKPAVEEGSDALDNLSLAIEGLKSTPTGVYIAMNGKIFETDKVRKNIEAGIFESLKDSNL